MASTDSAPVIAFEAVEGPTSTDGLTAAELNRWERLRVDADRDAYVSAHLLVRRVAGEFLKTDPGGLVLVQRCVDCGADSHGIPSIADHPEVHVSLSHTGGWVAAVAANVPCGIDVERVRPLSHGVVTRMLSDREREWALGQADPESALIEVWARKEARFKASGGVGVLLEVDGMSREGLTEWSSPDARGAAAVSFPA